jgi:hypothetical protein
VCVTCHGPVRDGRPECWCCRTVACRLGPAATRRLVVPLAVCRIGDPLHVVLRGYKDAPQVEARRHFAGLLRRHLAMFLRAHGPCMERASGGWDSMAVVPSTDRVSLTRRVAVTPAAIGAAQARVRHPLAAVVDGMGELRGAARIDLVRGAAPTDHLSPDRRAFAVSGDVRDRRVLLLDDTWVTGARMASAAAALEDAGAKVTAMVVAGRAVDTTVSSVARWWQRVEAGSVSGAGACPTPCCVSSRWMSSGTEYRRRAG